MESEPVMMVTEDSLRFVPSAVEGLTNVSEVAVFPDRLELFSEGQWIVFEFRDIARWYRRGWLYRPLVWLGFPIGGLPSVADRDSFHPPAGRFFRFYTKPAVTVYMPHEPPELDYVDTLFWRVQNIIGQGGFSTFDLG